MSYTVDLRGGPHDGEIVNVTNPPPIGTPILELGSTRAPYRLTLSAGGVHAVGEYVPGPGVRPWTWDPARGEWVAGDVIPSGSRLRLSEAGLAAIVGSAFGLLGALGLLAVYVVGWVLDYAAGALGGWLNLLGWSTLAGAIGCVVWAIIDPDVVRQDVPAGPEEDDDR